MEKYICWYAHEKQCVPHDTMVERMIMSTFSASNMHGVINDNSNPYRNMIMDVMRMNQGHANQFSIANEEFNANVAMFFDLLKDSDKQLWDICINHYGLWRTPSSGNGDEITHEWSMCCSLLAPRSRRRPTSSYFNSVYVLDLLYLNVQIFKFIINI